MIPLKLTLENFKCYRRNVPTLHLEGVHIICLSGANGHGKSSLLDAMAWALWGEAVHRPQEELVHVGEQDMRVEFEFLAGGARDGQGQRYRVIRRYARGRRNRAGTTSLEFQVANVQGQYQSISGNAVRDTESAIEKLVGMDYATFVNSAFLVQGRADELTTKRPAERQRVLGKILGLDLYDRLQERAKQKARENANEVQRLQGQIEVWVQNLADRPKYQEELPQVASALEEAKVRLTTVAQEADGLREQVKTLQQRQQELEELALQRERAREELAQLQAQALRHGQRVQQWEALAAREAEISQAFARLTEQKKQDGVLNSLLEPYARLQERVAALKKRADTLPALESACAEAQGKLALAEKREEALQAQRAELQDTQVKQQTLQAENQRLRQDMDGLRAKVDMLAQGDARCPLCGTELGEGGREHIKGEYEAQGKLLAQQYRQNSAALKELEPAGQRLLAIVEKAEKELAESRRLWHGRIAALNHQLEEARTAPAELEALASELERLGYAPATHQQVKEAIQGLASAEEEHRLLQQAIRDLPVERENLEHAGSQVRLREEANFKAEERMATIQSQVVGLPALEQRRKETEVLRLTLEERRQELVSRHGFLETRLRELGETEAKKASSESTLRGLSRQQEQLEQLATAFGRSGVQALLVEAAVPELEARANELLGRMTDNTMHLKLETQRESQRGELVETLEIKVSDPLGTRSYETFSGGEAFRINLALRIALSKLLAHRAGAPMPTLFIDEGFGTQDSTGRERILDVIQSIAEDFQRILVITHMDEVKDAFPVRIEVQKTPDGSTFVMT